MDGGINLYAYVSNNPLINTDPSGLCQAATNNKTPLWCQKNVIDAMKEAWSNSGNAGINKNLSRPPEAGFNVNGTPSNYQIDPQYTNEGAKMSITINNLYHDMPTFANFHIHPLGTEKDGLPSRGKGKDVNNFSKIYQDTGQAIQVFVMSWKGLSMFDPATGNSVMLVNGTGFLNGKGCPP